jgi:hypothetical protein
MGEVEYDQRVCCAVGMPGDAADLTPARRHLS